MGQYRNKGCNSIIPLGQNSLDHGFQPRTFASKDAMMTNNPMVQIVLNGLRSYILNPSV